MRSARGLVAVICAVPMWAVTYATPANAEVPLISHPIVDEKGNASWFSFASEPGGFSGDGTSRLITGPDFGFYVQGRLEQTEETKDSWDKLEVSVAGGSGYDERFRIDLSAPLGERLQIGTYPLAGNHLRRPEAQLDLGMNGHSCGDSTGSFTVHDIDDEVSRLWVTFEWFCGGSRPALTGEIRLNEPVMAGMTVAPTQVAWPGEAIGQRGRPVPVVIQNNGKSKVDVRSVAITSGAADFRIKYDECPDVLAAAEFCRIWLQFGPVASGPRDGALTVVTSAGTQRVPLSTDGQLEAPPPSGYRSRRTPASAANVNWSRDVPDAGTGGLTRWRMASDPDSYIGRGNQYEFLDEHVRWAYGWDNGFAFNARRFDDPRFPDGASFDASLYAGADEVLLPGLTVGGLRVSGLGRACSGRVSSFRITEAGYDLTGKLIRIGLSFRHRCVEDTGDLRGAIAWHALGPPPDVPGGYDDGGTDVPPGTGTTRPTTIFVLRVVDRPSGRIVIGGRLVSAGVGVSYARLLFERRTPLTGEWRRGGHVTTAANGRFRRSLSTRHTVAIRVSFIGAGKFAAARPQVIWLR